MAMLAKQGWRIIQNEETVLTAKQLFKRKVGTS
jgi:hypothetical protein